MGTTEPEPTEEELRAAYEAELKQIRIEHVLLEHVVTLVNLGMRRTGLAPGTEDERDPEQVQTAIDAIRGVMGVLERVAPAQVGPIRDALSQLQLAFVKIGGRPAGDATTAPPEPPPASSTAPPGGATGPEAESSTPGEPGPAQRSGRLWIPGQ